MIAPLYMIGEGGTCPKCSAYSGVECQIQYVAAEPFAGQIVPEHIRVHCPTCGFSECHPCADAPASQAAR